MPTHQSTLQFMELQAAHDPNCKEDSVRERILIHLIHALGYEKEAIVRSLALQNPFVKIGTRNVPVKQIPDYVLKVGDNHAWVLDAKSPSESVTNPEHLEQVYSYAIHPQIRTKYFALCNGIQFVLYRVDDDKPLLFFDLRDIKTYWEALSGYLSPDAFQLGKPVFAQLSKTAQAVQDFDYLKQPLLDEIQPQKQAVKRHFGVHGYFTKQTWNVVHEYIRHFSQPGDVVLDSFGGSGITAIEAAVLGRKPIHVDINPLSVFITETLLTPVKKLELQAAADQVTAAFGKKFNPIYKLEAQAQNQAFSEIAATYGYPKGIKLPKGADVQYIEQLFTTKQLAELSYLKHLISKTKNKSLKKCLMLMFSGLLTKINLTYHNSTIRGPGAGNSGVFQYYRYRIAPKPVDIDVMYYFNLRVKKVINALEEIRLSVDSQVLNAAKVIKGSATDLSFLKKESVDYIYTDPPYGKKIQYLDLSILWNAWLDLAVTPEDYQLEAIEGGELNKNKATYNRLIAKSIEEMFRVLKFNRWMSFVFAHKDPEFWHLIIETAEKCGFEYAGAVKQTNGQSSFKKRQNPFTVLSGQLIINFKKVQHPKAILKAALGMNIGDIVLQTVEGLIAKYNGATLEQINDELIIKGLELGFLDLLKKEYSDLTPILLQSFDYDSQNELFTLKKEAKFKTNIPLDKRIRFYLISFLRRQELEQKTVTFDEIILNIIPLLKNGLTPDDQTVLSELNQVAEKLEDNRWRLKKQHDLFS